MQRLSMLLRRKRGFLLLLAASGLLTIYLYSGGGGDGYFTRTPTPKEIEDILKTTPYLWRNFNLGENVTARSRIEAQQVWVRRLAETKYVENKKKVMWLEDDASYFYWTDGAVQCPPAPGFESKCSLVQMSPARRSLGSLRFFGVNADAVISVRNWEAKHTYAPPNSMMHILQILEPPSIAQNGNLGETNAILASYWRGSDIPLPYRVFVPHSDPLLRKPSRESVLEKVRSKRKLAAAIISNCDAPDRLQYVAQLQKYVDVDVYGRCGNFSCPKHDNHECLLKIESEYKFFLSFENSRCEDYVTEKLFDNALGFLIVPVVRGARPGDYRNSSPKDSFIHVDDFASPRHLGEYLMYLDTHEDAYLKYLEWKGAGYVSIEHFQDFFCRTCALLFYADFVPPPTWARPEIGWDDVSRCLEPGEGRW